MSSGSESSDDYDEYDMSDDFLDLSLVEGEEVESDDDNGERRWTTLQRLTAQQIRNLENAFTECPHPDENQRLAIAQRLDLDPSQIKFWFENRRFQEQMRLDREETRILRQEQDRLLKEHERLSEAIAVLSCNICGLPTPLDDAGLEEYRLMVENARLKQEINELIRFLTPFTPSLITEAELQMFSINPETERNAPTPDLDSAGGATPFTSDSDERIMYLNQANAALSELLKLGEQDGPYWRLDPISKKETLNYDEYVSVFKNETVPNGYIVEAASRDTSLILMPTLPLIKIFMETKKWNNVFAPIVSVASSRKVLPISPSGSRNGSLKLIEAEFHVISPLVPRRKVKFLRYCKEIREGLWTVVDVTPTQQTSPADSLSIGGCYRLPSGLIIEDMNNGYSKVTWVEQAHYDETNIHQFYKLPIASGIGLGAKRWLTTLHRYCESLPILSSTRLDQLYPGLSSSGAAEIVKLAERMSISYYSSVTKSSVFEWERVQTEYDGADIRLITREMMFHNVDPNDQKAYVMSASTSVKFPVSKQTLFNYLIDHGTRHHWDIMASDATIEDIFKFEKTKRHGHFVSLVKIIGSGMKVLQEYWNDASGAVFVYAPVDDNALERVMRGENSESVKILPCGFSIIPDEEESGGGGGGCLLTVGYQMLVTAPPGTGISEERLSTVSGLVNFTIEKIKLALDIQT